MERPERIDPLQNLRELDVDPILTREGLGRRGIGVGYYRHSLREVRQPPFENHSIVYFEKTTPGRIT